jgi:hypothetical protein
MNKPALPSKTLYQGKPYRRADHTDVRETWREFRAELDGPDYRQAEESEQAEYEQESK